MSNQSNLAELYTAFFNRAPDSAGLAYWVKELDSGVISLEQIAKNWVESQPEGQAKYPSGMTTTEFVNAIYDNVLSRSSDAEGLAYWQKQLDSGLISRDTFVAAVINGAKSNTTAQGKADAALLANKATVGVAFADKGLNDISLAAKVLTSVTADSNTLTATLNLIKLVPSTAAGQTTAVLNSLNTALTNVANLIKSAPGELGDLATYLNAVLSGVTSNTNLDTLFASINTKVVAAQTNPSALDDAANQGANDASIATPTAGGGDPGTPPVTTPTFTVTNGTGDDAGTFTVGTQNGEVKITISGTDVTFTPKTGTAVVVKLADITQGLVINGSVKVSAADLTTLTANEHQVTGTGTVSLGSDSLQNLASKVFVLKSHVEAHLAYTLTDGNFTAPEGSPVTVAQGEQSLELLQIIVSGATNGASITLNAVFSLQDTVEHLTAAINDELAVMHGRPYSVEDTLEHVLDAKADPESPLSLTDYTLTDAKVDLGQASVADIKAAKAQAQNVVDGASNVPPIPLEVTYTVKDSIAHLNAELDLPNPLLAGHSFSIADTLDNVLSHYDAETLPTGYVGVELTDTTAHLGEDLTVAQAVQATAHVQTVVNTLIPGNAIQVTADYTLADSVEHLVASPELLADHAYTVVDTLQNIVAYLASDNTVLTEGFAYTLTSAEVTVDGPSTAAQALALKVQYEALVAGALNSDEFTLKLVASLKDTAEHLADEQYASVVTGQHVEISDEYVSLEQLVAIQTIVGTDDGASVSYSGVAGDIEDLLNSHNADLIAEHAVSVTDGLSLAQLASLRDSDASSVTYTTVSDTVAALTAVENAGDVLGKTLHITGNPSFADIAAVTAAAGPDGSVSYDIVSDTFAELTDADNAAVVAGHAVEITDTVTIAQIKAVKALEDVGTVSYGTVDLADGTLAPDDAALLEGHALFASIVSVALIADFTALAGEEEFTYGIVTGTYAELTDPANLLAVTGHNLQPEGDVSVAQLRDLQELAGDGQTVAQHLITDTVAHLTDADNATILENHSIKVSDATVTVAQVQALSAIENIDEVIYETLADNAANLILASNEVVAGAVKHVQVSGTASISQLASITGKSPVSLTYTSITDIAENLVANTGGFVKEDVPVTVTGTASLSDLHAIDLKTTGEVRYSSITDTAEHLVADPDHYINSDVAVVVTGAINLSDLATLAGKADAVEYSSLTGTAAELAADAADQDGAGTFVTNGKAVQVTDAATVEQLESIAAAIHGTPDFSEIADTAEALVGNTVFVSIAAKVTVTDAASLQQLHDITATLLDGNEGELAYTAVKDTVEHLTANTDGFVRGAVDVTVTDEATVAAIAAISAATTGKVIAANISDEAGNIVSEEDGVSAYIGADSIVTVTDAVTIAQLKAIAAVNGGEAKLLYSHISDTLENLNADGASAFIKHGITVTVTDDSATVAQLAALDAASDGNLEYIGAINDTAQALADDAALNNGDGKYIAGKVVTVSDAATLLQLADIADAADELHYTKISDTAEHLVTNTGSFVTTGKTVTVIDAASILQLSTIDGYTDVALVYTKVTDSSAALALDTTYVKDGVTVTLTDSGIVAAATLAAIDAKTDVQVDASSVGVVTGNFADVKAVVSASATLKLSGSEVLNVTDTAANLSGKTLDASTSGMDTLHVGLASNITDLTHLTGFEDVTLEGSSRFTNLIKVGGDANEVHALAGSTVSLVGTNQSFWTSADTDIVTMGAGSKFVFAASAAANGTDKISGFTFGAEGNAFDFSSFFGGVATAGSDIVNDTAQFGGGANTVTLVDGNSTVLAAHNTISVADFNSTFLSKVDGKEVIVTFDNTAHAANVYFVNSAGGGAANAVDSAADITLVGTVTYTGSISSAADLNLASHLMAP